MHTLLDKKSGTGIGVLQRRVWSPIFTWNSEYYYFEAVVSAVLLLFFDFL